MLPQKWILASFLYEHGAHMWHVWSCLKGYLRREFWCFASIGGVQLELFLCPSWPEVGTNIAHSHPQASAQRLN